MLGMTRCAALLIVAVIFASAASAANCPTTNVTLVNGTPADATPVNTNFANLLNCANTYLAPLASPSFTGNVGIGTTAPSQRLDVEGGNMALGSSQLIGSGTGYGCSGCAQAGTIELYDGTTGYTTIQSGTSYGLLLNPGGGNVGIGTTNPTKSLDVYGGSIRTQGAINGSVIIDSNNASSPQLDFGNNVGATHWIVYETLGAAGQQANFNLYDGVTSANALTIAATTDYVGIGTTTPAYPLTVNGTAYATSFTTTSDVRHKQDITPLSEATLPLVMRLRPVSFRWKDAKDDGMKGRQIGFIAQDVMPVLPYVVLTMNNAEHTLGLKYDDFIPVLTKAIQEQQAQISTLTAANQVQASAIQAQAIASHAQAAAIRSLQAQVALLLRRGAVRTARN
jgi:hypothetical protein